MMKTGLRSRPVNARHRRVLSGLQCLSAVTAIFGGIVGAQAQLSPSAQRGMTFARANCSHCHAVDKVSSSPLAIAPPFRTLHQRYPVETLEEALGEGIITGHNNMPEFKLEPDQVGDFITFLKSLEQ
jgi:cytochrome c